MTGNKCCLCPNYSGKNPMLTYHLMPADKKRRELWLQKCPKDKIAKLRTFKRLTICSCHFNKNDYNSNGRLKKDAVPSSQSISSNNKKKTLKIVSGKSFEFVAVPEFISRNNKKAVPSTSSSSSSNNKENEAEVPELVLFNACRNENESNDDRLKIDAVPSSTSSSLNNKENATENVPRKSIDFAEVPELVLINTRSNENEPKKDASTSSSSNNKKNVPRKSIENVRVPKLVLINTPCDKNRLNNERAYQKTISKLIENNKKLKSENDALKMQVQNYKNDLKRKEKIIYKYKSKTFSDRALNDAIKKKLSHVFSKTQLDLILEKRKQVKWTSDDLSRAFTIRQLSPRCYKYLRDTLCYPLPAIRSLQHWAAKIDIKPGFFADVIKIMDIASKSLKDLEKVAVLSFGEIKVKRSYEYNEVEDKIVPNYSQMSVLMVHGLIGRWKQPIYINFDSKISKEILFGAIKRLEKISYHIVACVSNCTNDNLELQDELGLCPEKCFFENPYNQEPVYYFTDVQHLIAMLRNLFIDHGFILDDGTILNKQPLIELLQCTPDIDFQLTYEHLNETEINRQNVQIAIETFSSQTAFDLRKYKPGFDEYAVENLADFIDIVNNWFVIMNSDSKFDEEIQKCYGLMLSEQNVCLDAMFNVVGTMIFETGLQSIQNSILLSITSLQQLLSYLKEKFNCEYILTKRLNHDTIETFSNQLQQHDGQVLNTIRHIILETNPEIIKLDSIEKEYLTNNFLKRSNITIKDFDVLDTAASSFADGNTPEITNDSLEFIAGWIANKFRDTNPELGDPAANMENRKYLLPPWVENFVQEGIIQPSAVFKEKIIFMNNYLEDKYPLLENCENFENIIKTLITQMKKKKMVLSDQILKTFFTTRIMIRIIYLNTLSEEKKNFMKKRRSMKPENEKIIKKMKK